MIKNKLNLSGIKVSCTLNIPPNHPTSKNDHLKFEYLMKRILFFLLLMACLVARCQDLPTLPASGYAFPIGSKFTIKLVPSDSVNFFYSVTHFEEYTDVVDIMRFFTMFEPEGPDSTISFYFCLGTLGKDEQERKENMKVLLLMKNYSKYPLKYTSDIQRVKNGEFENTSNIGMLPNVPGNEMWPYMIYSIRLTDIQIDTTQNEHQNHE